MVLIAAASSGVAKRTVMSSMAHLLEEGLCGQTQHKGNQLSWFQTRWRSSAPPVTRAGRASRRIAAARDRARGAESHNGLIGACNRDGKNRLHRVEITLSSPGIPVRK